MWRFLLHRKREGCSFVFHMDNKSKFYSARAARAFTLAQSSTKVNKMPFFLARESDSRFFGFVKFESFFLLSRLSLSATSLEGATVAGR